jgi:allophanate hydrolase subunit 1
VAAGSVAIGGAQTGIYPRESPGGWRILGRTPLVLFDPQRDPPTLLQPGDRVRFIAIDAIAIDAVAIDAGGFDPGGFAA